MIIIIIIKIIIVRMVTFCHQPPKLDLNSGFVPETSRSSPPALNVALSKAVLQSLAPC